ncbi:MAG: hypothetical protein XE10_0797 [Methanoculleus marisnigri]|jgi:hypothetical protein|uniref:Uncharacterized protein n=1 Tax=Methanoculleus marisnigri TaxID=2198 RepID=A0A101GR85_9EURY|nr:MAG: hypothetical protein XD82_0540 [Methanoculleus marisnigri]KUL02152.1 MAG: hypothetical protein XE10_0797 [Methanoculleus marisnigri]
MGVFTVLTGRTSHLLIGAMIRIASQTFGDNSGATGLFTN